MQFSSSLRKESDHFRVLTLINDIHVATIASFRKDFYDQWYLNVSVL